MSIRAVTSIPQRVETVGVKGLMVGSPWCPQHDGDEWIIDRTLAFLGAGMWIPIPILTSLLALDYPEEILLTPRTLDPVFREWDLEDKLEELREIVRPQNIHARGASFEDRSSKRTARGLGVALELALLLCERDKSFKVEEHASKLLLKINQDRPKEMKKTGGLEKIYRLEIEEMSNCIDGSLMADFHDILSGYKVNDNSINQSWVNTCGRLI